MDKLEQIAEQIRLSFETQNEARDKALVQTRTLTRHCAHAIRAVHRQDREQTNKKLAQAGKIVQALCTTLKTEHPYLYFAGYTQDALKEYVEARVVYALVDDDSLPTPDELETEPATYMKGLAEAVGELRRRILDILRGGHSQEAERLLQHMDDIYAVLVTMDYPDAVTYGLRRQTDICRSIIERTRGDITLSFRQHQLEKTIRKAEENLLEVNGDTAE